MFLRFVGARVARVVRFLSPCCHMRHDLTPKWPFWCSYQPPPPVFFHKANRFTSVRGSMRASTCVPCPLTLSAACSRSWRFWAPTPAHKARRARPWRVHSHAAPRTTPARRCGPADSGTCICVWVWVGVWVGTSTMV